jgi:protein-disulfide isomerase
VAQFLQQGVKAAVRIALDLLLVVGVGTLLFLVYARQNRQPLAGGLRIAERDWELLVGSSSANVRAAPVTVVEFVDYQCPSCRQLEHVMTDIETQSHGRLRRLIRHFPIEGHLHARAAAQLAVCSPRSEAAQSRIHSRLYSRPSWVDAGLWDSILVALPAEGRAAVLACAQSPTAAATVDADQALGERLGVSGTPTLIVNGILLKPTSAAAIRSYLLDLLQ